MNEIKIFDNPQFGQIRTMGTPEEPWFCATDVCKALGYTNGRKAVADHVDEGDVTKRYTPTTNQYGAEVTLQMTYVNESGLYALIFGSKLPDAKDFKRWVTSDVLPTIRKTGGYIAANAEMSDEEIMSRALEIAHRTIERKNAELKELESKNAEQQRIIVAKDNAIAERDRKIEEDAPKVATADALCVSKDACDIGVFAKILTQNGYDIGKNRLFDYLRKHKYLFKRGGFNFPYQKYVERKIFEVCESTVPVPGKSQHITSFKTLVTGKGQMYFINLFLKGVQTIQFDENDTREYVPNTNIKNE